MKEGTALAVVYLLVVTFLPPAVRVALPMRPVAVAEEGVVEVYPDTLIPPVPVEEVAGVPVAQVTPEHQATPVAQVTPRLQTVFL